MASQSLDWQPQRLGATHDRDDDGSIFPSPRPISQPYRQYSAPRQPFSASTSASHISSLQHIFHPNRGFQVRSFVAQDTRENPNQENMCERFVGYDLWHEFVVRSCENVIIRFSSPQRIHGATTSLQKDVQVSNHKKYLGHQPSSMLFEIKHEIIITFHVGWKIALTTTFILRNINQREMIARNIG